MRGLLDMMGVKPDFLTCGKYKSAAEIFMRKGPSPEAAQMRNWLLDSLYESYQKTVAQGSGVKSAQVASGSTVRCTRRSRLFSKGSSTACSTARTSKPLRKKFGDNVKFDMKYGKKQRGGTSIFRRPSDCSSSGRKCSRAERRRRGART